MADNNDESTNGMPDEEFLKKIAAQANIPAPNEPQSYVASLTRASGGADGFMTDGDDVSEAIMQLFEVPGDMTNLVSLQTLLLRSDLPEHQVKLVSRILALSMIFEPKGGAKPISVPRVIIGWYLLARIARDRKGREEYAAVLGYKLEDSQREGGDL